MYAIIIVIHVIVSLFLIAVILLQAGRGGGLADSFGGSQMQSLFGTKSTAVLTKLTAICATMFILTCLSLALISSHRSKSLVEKVNIPDRAERDNVDVSGSETQEPVTVLPEETQGDADETEAE